MDQIIEFFQNVLDKQWLLENNGLYIIMLIVFAETGLFIGFFLPGDQLIFLTGMLLYGYPEPYDTNLANWFFWSSIILGCAVVGNMVGYWFGYKSGTYLFKRKDTWFLKKKHLYQAKDFYEKKGGFAIIIARFLPVIRTFAPIIAGVVKMDIKKFILFNIIGGALWIYGLTFAGYWLGKYQWVQDNLGYILIGIIVVTTGPVLFKMIFGKKETPVLDAPSNE